MMCIIGFGEKWLSWIRACIFSSNMSVIVNSSTTNEFCVGTTL